MGLDLIVYALSQRCLCYVGVRTVGADHRANKPFLTTKRLSVK